MADWGRAALLGLFALFVVAATPADAAKGKGLRHAKLDSQLNELADTGGDSRVIIEFNDERDAVNLVRAHGGKSGRRLAILNARPAEQPAVEPVGLHVPVRRDDSRMHAGGRRLQ